MIDLPRLKFRRATTSEYVADRESSTIPRVGESVWLESETWSVIGVVYLFPSPGSSDYNAGRRAPLVYLDLL